MGDVKDFPRKAAQIPSECPCSLANLIPSDLAPEEIFQLAQGIPAYRGRLLAIREDARSIVRQINAILGDTD